MYHVPLGPSGELRANTFDLAFALLTILLCACLIGSSAGAQDVDEFKQVALKKARVALFNVEVMGTPSDPNDVTQEATRWGKAFAVGSDLLVTALHVVGSEAEWKLKRTTRDEITRAVRPISRTVSISAANGKYIDPGKTIVLPSPPHTVDVASILLPQESLSEFFQLSLCDLVEGETYFALMTTSDNPRIPASLEDLEIVPLIAQGYNTEYGPLYTFLPDGAMLISSEPWGHDGSPILDAEGNAVAVISAVTVTAGGTIILASPIQPLFPGALQLLAKGSDTESVGGGRLKCSMVDTVRRISEQMSSYAIWSAFAEIRDGKPSGQIVIEYESVADPPNVASIEIRYRFLGIERDGEEESRINAPQREGEQDVVVLLPSKGRSFSTSAIVAKAREVYLPYVRQNDGYISTIELLITPTTTSGDVLKKRVKTISIPWAAFDQSD